MIMAIALSITGCYYDNEEDLYPGSNSCDTSKVTYSGTVAPVFATYCNSCHSGNNPSGAISTDNYNSVKTNISVINGAIKHQSGYSPMPKGSSKLSDCDLAKIDIWVRQGMPNN
jgi:mono/diheme cytochrome c family protein